MIFLNSKNILLVHPLGYRKEAAGKDIARIASIIPPIGLAGIAAYLEKRGIDVSIIDCYARPDSDSLIRGYLQSEKPAFLGLSCTTSTFLDGVRTAKLAKSILPDIKVIFGGAHVSALKERILKDFPVIDFTVIGEGEETLAELMEKNGEDISSVPGIIYREKENEILFTGRRSTGIDLDTLPFPSYEKLEGFPSAYKAPLFSYPKAPSSSCITSRGCPYACSYCDRSVFGRSFRYNSAEYMYEHVNYLNARFGVKHIIFYDDQFTFKRERIVDFAKMMINRPRRIYFNCVARAEHIDYELLLMLKEAGCWMISLGIETGDENLLARHRQNANLSMLSEKIHLIKKAGIRTKGLFMIGLPGETEEGIRKSVKFVISNPIDELNVAKFTPFPGSPIYEKIHEMGEFNEDWELMDCMNFLFIPEGMTKERLEELFKLFYRKHFRRSEILLGYTSMIWRSPDSWKRVLQNLPSLFKFVKSDKRLGT
ncbi:MAG: radical SAM protein [Desulfobacterales bacterium]|nr:radical SAM protein [Desulfobacterales bacterium]